MSLGNPYQAPGAQNHAGSLPPRGAALKWLYVGGHAAYWVFTFGGLLLTAILGDATGARGEGAVMASRLPLAGVVFLLVALVGAALWLHRAWESVPAAMRYTNQGRWVTPAKAVGYLFVPFYNLYWMFVVTQGLCDAVDRTLLAQGAQPRAPRGLATAACTTQLVPYCNLLIAPILWAFFMFQVDRARSAMGNDRA